MLSAKARGELVEKRLVELQASFLLVGMRRQALALPQALCGRLAAVSAPLEVKAILDDAMRSLLSEVQDLPNRIDAAEWAKFLAEEEGNGAAEPRRPQAEMIGSPPLRRMPKGRPRQPGPQCKPDVR